MTLLRLSFLICLCCIIPAQAQQHKSDREDAGLKDKVKSVVEEKENFSNTTNQQSGKRQRKSKAQYDEQGNLTESLSYDYRGNLSQKTIYLTVDGSRAMKSEIIQHDYDPPPMVAPNTSKPADSRYDIRYEDKYDEKGNRVERVLIYNDGNRGNKITAGFDEHGNKVKWELYTRDGKLNYGTRIILDEKGNEIETTGYGAVESKSRYEYLEFDSKGNWTKRKMFKLNNKTGQFELDSVTYRTITYY